jgi:hypothetical protein
MTLGACAQGGLTDAERSRATTLPTPTTPAAAPQHVLRERVRSLLDSRSVTVDEDLHLAGRELVVRLTMSSLGKVVQATFANVGQRGADTEVFRNPAMMVERHSGPVEGAECWWPAGPELASYDRPVAQDLAVLTSGRATSGSGSLVTGTVSALDLLRVLGTDAELRRRGMLPPSRARVPASFAVEGESLLLTTSYDDLLAAAGHPRVHAHVGTWTFRFQRLPGPPPPMPPPGQVLRLTPSSPGFAAALRACNAGVR